MKAQIHCPFTGCLYFAGSGKHFTQKKFLNQHIAKVHAEKKFSCGKCKKSFGLDWWRKHHEKTCGIEWECQCGVKYASRETLLTHARRNQHQLPDHVLHPHKGKHVKASPQMNNTPVILLIQPIIQNITCIQPVESTIEGFQPNVPKPIQPCFYTMPSSANNADNAYSPVYPPSVQETSNEGFVFNVSSNTCSDTMSSQVVSSTMTSADIATSCVQKPIQISTATQTTDDIEVVKRLRESRASQCSRRKSKRLNVGIESTHTQTAESAVVKIKKRRSRRKSVAITTESNMLSGPVTSMGQSLWPNFKDLVLPNTSSSCHKAYKSTTSTQTSTNKVLCDSQTITDDELFKFVWDEAVKGKDTSDCFNSLVGMLPDINSSNPMTSLHDDIGQSNLPMLEMFSPSQSVTEPVLSHDDKSCLSAAANPSKILNASSDKETCTLFSVYDNCLKPVSCDVPGITISHTQSSPNVLDYNLLENIKVEKSSMSDMHSSDLNMHTEAIIPNTLNDFHLLDSSQQELHSKVSDIHTQTMSTNVLDYNLLANMETQTTDDFSLYDLEFSDTETQTPWDDFPNLDDSPLRADQLSIEIQTDFSSLTPSIEHDPYDFMNGLNMPTMMGACSNKERLGVNSETQTLDKFTFPQFTNSESQTLDPYDFVFSSMSSS